MLMSRLFGLFALKSRKSLFLMDGISSIDRARLKESALKKGYDRLLSEYAKPETNASISLFQGS